MNLADYDYDLPASFIAQTPAEPRDSSKLLLLDRATGAIEHRIFRDITAYIHPGDVLVLNTTRVIPARLHATKAETGGGVEVLLLRQLDATRWRVIVGGRRVGDGVRLHFDGVDIGATVTETLEEAERIIVFDEPINRHLQQIGETPLPPYIHNPNADPERYQTVFSREEGSAAAPTAGLHFTPELLAGLRDKGVQIANCLLHIGLGTFQPLRDDQLARRKLHSEYAMLSATDAQIINETKQSGGRVIAVGTTVVRTLETAGLLSAGGDPSQPDHDLATNDKQPVVPFERDTDLFIYPGFRWRVVDGLITNFHLPKSSLLMLVSSFAGRKHILNAYETAKRANYRFYSFGDAMFICKF